MNFKGFFGRFISVNLSADSVNKNAPKAAPQQNGSKNTIHTAPNKSVRENALRQDHDSGPFRPIPAEPDKDVPSNFVPYEGTDMTCAEASAAGFEFIGADRYHGVDGWIGKTLARRSVNGEIFHSSHGQYNGSGISGCAVTGFHGHEQIIKVPRSINGRPVVKIEDKAFAYNQNIREIYIPDSVIDIGADVFYSCRCLVFARLSANLAHIGERAFSSCIALEKVYLGNAAFIDRHAFYGCKRLSSVRLPDDIQVLGSNAFGSSGLRVLYRKKITCGGDNIVFDTPYEKEHRVILLGDCLQKCSVEAKGEIIIDDPNIKVIGSYCFSKTSARKVTLSENVRKICRGGFLSKPGYKIDEIYAPRLFVIGNRCFSRGQKLSISTDAEYIFPNMAAKGYLCIEEDSFEDTDAERLCPGGSSEKPCVCVTVRNILARVEQGETGTFGHAEDVHRSVLTLSEDGSTLVMDDRIKYTAAEHIPNLGAKRLILSCNLCSLYSFNSIADFDEIVILKPVLYTRCDACDDPAYLKKSIILRFKYQYKNFGSPPVDSEFLLYMPPAAGRSEEAERLREFYEKCLGTCFSPKIYDSEILKLVSSYRARFTISRLRLEGGHGLTPEAKKAYEKFLIKHRRKAEFTAKKHGDNALLALLEKLSENSAQPKGVNEK